jgi:hypothetical protein
VDTREKQPRPRLRKPLILTFAELQYLTFFTGDEMRKLRLLRPSSRFGRARLKMLSGLQGKLWSV